ncbi:MAG TPA: NAD-dependent epimerase/dehydratase family protein [Gemmatimonadaceae bacterium]|nr:NAD-dependent epimerase/dehydratase family protein [Gemmatimonadaceae bacterium]
MPITQENQHDRQSPLRIAVTGASGFAGQSIVRDLRNAGHIVRPIVRRPVADDADTVTVADIGPSTDWTAALREVDVVVHCAAIAADSRRSAGSPADKLTRVNVLGTRRLAEESARLGVRRLVFVSSIKAIAGNADNRCPLTPADSPLPGDAYGDSKLAAERDLQAVASSTGLEAAIVRPPLIYGPGVRGNFRALLKAARSGIPLPVAGIENRRSYLGLTNLTSFIRTCAEHSAGAGGVYHISDGEDLSTHSLMELIAKAMGRKPRTFRVPTEFLSLARRVPRLRRPLDSLLGSLQLDINDARRSLGWSPAVTAETQISETVDWYLSASTR